MQAATRPVSTSASTSAPAPTTDTSSCIAVTISGSRLVDLSTDSPARRSQYVLPVLPPSTHLPHQRLPVLQHQGTHHTSIASSHSHHHPHHHHGCHRSAASMPGVQQGAWCSQVLGLFRAQRAATATASRHSCLDPANAECKVEQSRFTSPPAAGKLYHTIAPAAPKDRPGWCPRPPCRAPTRAATLPPVANPYCPATTHVTLCSNCQHSSHAPAVSLMPGLFAPTSPSTELRGAPQPANLPPLLEPQSSRTHTRPCLQGFCSTVRPTGPAS